MTDTPRRTALVTGANSGLGFEASAQLGESDYDRVIITSRSDAKASSALERLVARTGKQVFETLVLDNDDLSTVEAAASSLAERRGKIDVVLLNAGAAPPKSLHLTADGLEGTVAATLVGHHLLTMRLLELGLLRDSARIVITGSEAARGDVPTFNPLDVDAFAARHFDSDPERAIEAPFRMQPPTKYKPSDAYATTKLFAAWWAAELAKVLPKGVTVNAVSPGSTPDTNAAQHAPLYMRKLMMPLFKLIPGMSHSVREGAARYLEAVGFGEEVSGQFFASAPKKMTGPLMEIRMDHIDNPEAQRALWNVTIQAAGDIGHSAAA